MLFRTALPLVLLCLAAPARTEPIDVLASPIALNQSAPGDTTIGSLRYLGGLVLSSPDHRFGGWSGLLVNKTGRRITAVSDKGHLMSLHLTYSASGRLSGVAEADISPLRDTDGDVLDSKHDSDAEALAAFPDGRRLIAFERRHRINSYADTWKSAHQLTLPPQFLLMGRNGGVEALSVLPDGRLLALSEGFVTSNGLLGWLGYPREDGLWDWETLSYPYDGRNVPTGATTLPSGDILVVERRYSPLEGVAMRLRRIPGEQMTPGATLAGPVLADMAQPYSVDNFEGIAVFRDAEKRLRVLIISDDNFSALQRTLLLSFGLDDPAD